MSLSVIVYTLSSSFLGRFCTDLEFILFPFRFQLNRCHESLEAIWSENTGGASFFNLSSLPAFLNSSCLHKLRKLSDLSCQTSCTQVWVCHEFLYAGMGLVFCSLQKLVCFLLSIKTSLSLIMWADSSRSA